MQVRQIWMKNLQVQQIWMKNYQNFKFASNKVEQNYNKNKFEHVQIWQEEQNLLSPTNLMKYNKNKTNLDEKMTSPTNLDGKMTTPANLGEKMATSTNLDEKMQVHPVLG